MARILVVDDEPSYLEHLSVLLSREGHEVVTSDNGETAIKAGADFRPDVLVVDWKLKGRLNGLDVIRALRAARLEFAAVVMTGYSADQIASAAEDLGPLQILEKPFDAAAIRQTVREAIQNT